MGGVFPQRTWGGGIVRGTLSENKGGQKNFFSFFLTYNIPVLLY